MARYKDANVNMSVIQAEEIIKAAIIENVGPHINANSNIFR